MTVIPGSSIANIPFYRPWIGGRYSSRQQMLELGRQCHEGNAFLHVMGESHYSDDYEDSRDLTVRVVADWAFARSAGGRFFTKVLQATQGVEAADVNRIRGWSDIAYSNFVQRLLNQARQAPSDEDWNEARLAFNGQLALTRPRVLLVLGERLWSNLPSDNCFPMPSLMVNDRWRPVDDSFMYAYWLNHRIELTIAVHTAHPSSSKFDWARAYEKVCTADMLYDNLAISMREDLTDSESPPAPDRPAKERIGFVAEKLEERADISNPPDLSHIL